METPKAPITSKQARGAWRGLTQLRDVIFGFASDAGGQVHTIKRRFTGAASGSAVVRLLESRVETPGLTTDPVTNTRTWARADCVEE